METRWRYTGGLYREVARHDTVAGPRNHETSERPGRQKQSAVSRISAVCPVVHFVPVPFNFPLSFSLSAIPPFGDFFLQHISCICHLVSCFTICISVPWSVVCGNMLGLTGPNIMIGGKVLIPFETSLIKSNINRSSYSWKRTNDCKSLQFEEVHIISACILDERFGTEQP